MKQPKPTRKSVLEEMLAQAKNQLDAEQDRMIKKVLTEKHQLIQQMLDELPHYVWPEPSLPSYFSDRRRYYQIFLGSPSGWAGDMTHTEDPHPYIKWVSFEVENSEQNEWRDFVYGFISPEGLTVQCLYEGHMRCAEAIWKQYYPDEHARYEVDALAKKGWIEILRDDDESVWINANRRWVTKPQAEALITVGHDKSPRAHSIIVASEKYW